MNGTMNAIWQVILAVLALFGLLFNAGCGSAYWAGTFAPRTEVVASHGLLGTSLKITNTKDVVLALKGVRYSPEAGLQVESFDVQDLSTPVIDAQSRRAEALVEIMQVQVDLHRQIGANIALALAAGGEAAGNFVKAATGWLQGSSVMLQGAGLSGKLNLGTGGEPCEANRQEPADSSAGEVPATPAAGRAGVPAPAT